jgi:hypothetical protein
VVQAAGVSNVVYILQLAMMHLHGPVLLGSCGSSWRAACFASPGLVVHPCGSYKVACLQPQHVPDCYVPGFHHLQMLLPSRQWNRLACISSPDNSFVG